jgi:hypothetical protein
MFNNTRIIIVRFSLEKREPWAELFLGLVEDIFHTYAQRMRQVGHNVTADS